MLWALEDAPAVLRAYREFVASAPQEVATLVTLRRAPPAAFLPLELHRRPVCLVSMLALADPGRAERLLAPMRTFGSPLLDLVTHRPLHRLAVGDRRLRPHGWQHYGKFAGLQQLDNPVIDTMVDHASRAHSPWSYALLFHLGGAVAEADPQATAYSRRAVTHELNVKAVWLPHDPTADAETGWARAFIADLEPYAAGAYLNFLDRDDQHRTPAAFEAAAYQRLLDLQQRLDPDQVFCSRPGVKPSRFPSKPDGSSAVRQAGPTHMQSLAHPTSAAVRLEHPAGCHTPTSVSATRSTRTSPGRTGKPRSGGISRFHRSLRGE